MLYQNEPKCEKGQPHQDEHGGSDHEPSPDTVLLPGQNIEGDGDGVLWGVVSAVGHTRVQNKEQGNNEETSQRLRLHIKIELELGGRASRWVEPTRRIPGTDERREHELTSTRKTAEGAKS
jgi:hypothetical protein